MNRRVVLALALVLALVAGCQRPPARPLGDGEVWLPVSEMPSSLCAGGGVEAVLRGSPEDPRITWLQGRDGIRVELEVGWPPDYSARFAPKLEVLDPDGRVIARDGSSVSNFCVGAEGVVLYELLPPGWYDRASS